ncbi:unnamed protein product [Pedinophyceae sp. YPF-701]|nr:unnamed protein product [Pedinophyceae sp. YPF-701]
MAAAVRTAGTKLSPPSPVTTVRPGIRRRALRTQQRGWSGRPVVDRKTELSARSRVAASAAEGTTEVIEWDVVAYRAGDDDEPSSVRLGRVTWVGEEEIEADPLVEDEEEPGVWVPQKSVEPATVPLRNVLEVVQHEYSQRQEKENNPHSEHAEDVFTVQETGLRSDVLAALRRR